MRRNGGATVGAKAPGLASRTEMAKVSGVAAPMPCGERHVSMPVSVSIVCSNRHNRSPVLTLLPLSYLTSPSMSQTQPTKTTKRKPRQRGGKLPEDAPLTNPVEDEQDLLEGLTFPKFGYALPPRQLTLFSLKWLTIRHS